MAYNFDQPSFADQLMIMFILCTAILLQIPFYDDHVTLLGTLALLWAALTALRILWLMESAKDFNHQHDYAMILPLQITQHLAKKNDKQKLHNSLKTLNRPLLIWFLLALCALGINLYPLITHQGVTQIASFLCYSLIASTIFWNAQLYACLNRHTSKPVIICAVLIALALGLPQSEHLITVHSGIQWITLSALAGWTILYLVKGIIKQRLQRRYAYTGLVISAICAAHIAFTGTLSYPAIILALAVLGICWVRTRKRSTKIYRPFMCA